MHTHASPPGAIKSTHARTPHRGWRKPQACVLDPPPPEHEAKIYHTFIKVRKILGQHTQQPATTRPGQYRHPGNNPRNITINSRLPDQPLKQGTHNNNKPHKKTSNQASISSKAAAAAHTPGIAGPTTIRGLSAAIGAAGRLGAALLLLLLLQGVGLRFCGRHFRLDLRPGLGFRLQSVLLLYPRLHCCLIPQHLLLLPYRMSSRTIIVVRLYFSIYIISYT